MIMINREFEIVNDGLSYELPTYEVKTGVGIQRTDKVIFIPFVRGSSSEGEPVVRQEGVIHENLLAMMIHDLQIKNQLVPSRETSLAITKLQEALLWLEERQRIRAAQGVRGTYQKDK